MKLDHLSWSKENTLEKCGQQFYYRYLEKLKRPPGVAIVRGKAPHRSAEADLKTKLETGALLDREAVGQIATDYVDKSFRGEVAIDGEFEGMSVKEAKIVCKEDARKMAFLHHDRLAPGIIPTALELRVTARFPELPVPYKGVIDLVDDHTDVRDLKTKRKAPEKNEAHTSEQLTVYWGLFSAHKRGAPINLALDVLWVTPGGKSDGRTLLTTRSADAWAIKIARSLKAIEAIEKEIFLPAAVDAWICAPRWCGYTDVCPYYRGRPRATS